MQSTLFQRGITFETAAPPAARALAGQIAASLGVTATWTDGGRRLVVAGSASAVDGFFALAQAALTVAGRQPAAA